MANGFTDWSGMDRWNIAAPTTGAYKGFADVPERATALGPLDAYRTPQEDWMRFMSQAQPFWSTRAPMADIGQRLRARYLLAAPDMLEQEKTPSFGQFLSDFPGRFGGGVGYGAGADPVTGAEVSPQMELEELRARATEAARAATTAAGEYMAGVQPETPEFRRRAWLQAQFGGEDAAQNQMAVANLLALQRGRGGLAKRDPYRGRMADAIRNAMTNLYQQRLNVGAPRENFLNWYLQQTKRPATTTQTNGTNGGLTNLPGGV